VDGAPTDCSTPGFPRPPRAAGTRPASAHRHGAAIVASQDELLAAALPFLEEGLRAGDLIAVSCPPETVELLTGALGERATAVEIEPRMSLLGARAPDALVTCRRYLERAVAAGNSGDSGRLRVLGEVDFGTDPDDWREGQRFESVFNRVIGDAPVVSVCMYDRRRLPAVVVDSAAATHPHIVRGDAWAASPGFQDPGVYVPSLPLPRASVEDAPPVYSVDDAPSLPSLRHQIGAVLASLVPDREQREDMHLAAAEIAANAFRHGVRPVSARVWAAGDRVICVISDRGTSYTDPLSGFTPAHGLDLSKGGMGLWLARKLWDHVDVLPTEAGLSVRLSSRLR
jgi:anti-sigma regulatory factor (Ser/Thr protein kinase)